MGDGMSTADDLRAAARYINSHGLARETAELPDGSVCALGEIARSLGLPIMVVYDGSTDSRYNEARYALMDYLCSGYFTYLPGWSDTHTQAEVVAALEKAAAWIEEQA
jgi:hypothetical protein